MRDGSGRAITILALAYGVLAVLCALAIESRAQPPAIWDQFDQPVYRAMADHPFSADPDVTTPPWCWRVLPSLIVHEMHLGADRGFHVLTLGSFAALPAVMMLLLRSMRISESTTILIGALAALLPPINGNLAWAYAMTDAFVVVLIACAVWATVAQNKAAMALCLILLALSKETWTLAAAFAVIWTALFNRAALTAVAAAVVAAGLVFGGLRVLIHPSAPYSTLATFENLYLPWSARNVLRRALLATAGTWNVLTPVLAVSLARLRLRREALAIGCVVVLSMLQPLLATETMRPVAAAAPVVFIACAMEFERWPSRVRRGAGPLLVAAQIPWLLSYGYVARPPLRWAEILLAVVSLVAIPLAWGRVAPQPPNRDRRRDPGVRRALDVEGVT
jgi:hypothetical protein